LYLSRFDFILKYAPENKIEKVDNLSRKLDWEVEVKKNNKNKMLIKPKWLEVRKIKKVEIIVEEVDLLEKVKQSKVKDNKIIKAVEEIKQTRVKILRNEEWKEVNGVIYKEKKIYILRNKKLRAEIIQLHHNTLVEEYERQWKIVELVTRNF